MQIYFFIDVNVSIHGYRNLDEYFFGHFILVGTGLSERSFRSQHEHMYSFIFKAGCCFKGFSSQRITEMISVLPCVCVFACMYEQVHVGRVELFFGSMSDKPRL